MAALLERANRFRGVRNRYLVRAEILPLQGAVPALHAARRDLAPRARTAEPGAVGAAEGEDAVLARRAVHAFVADVVDALGAARHQRVADDALLHADRSTVDEEFEIARRADEELDQVFGARKCGQLRQHLGTFLHQAALVLPFPVALHVRAIAAAGAKQRHKVRQQQQSPQARSCARAERMPAGIGVYSARDTGWAATTPDPPPRLSPARTARPASYCTTMAPED